MQNVLARIVSLPLSLIGIGKPVPSQKRVAYDKRMAKFRQEQQQAAEEWTPGRAAYLRKHLQPLDSENTVMNRTYACLLEQ